MGNELYRCTKDGGIVVWIVGDNTSKFCESLSSFKQALYFVEKGRIQTTEPISMGKEQLYSISILYEKL
jgi:hypothetical protein